MKTKHVAKLVVVLIIVGSLNSAPRSFGQSSKRDDSLKPFTTCELDNGLRIVQVDRLPKKVKSRTVTTSKGDQAISLADGYRVMVAYNDDRDWFANIKAEKSVTTEYERDKEGVIENLKWAATTSKELESQEPVKVSVGEYEGYGTSKRTLVGDMLGIYVLFSDVNRLCTKRPLFLTYVSRKDAKAQTATAFLKDFFAPCRLCGRRSPPQRYFSCKATLTTQSRRFTSLTRIRRENDSRPSKNGGSYGMNF